MTAICDFCPRIDGWIMQDQETFREGPQEGSRLRSSSRSHLKEACWDYFPQSADKDDQEKHHRDLPAREGHQEGAETPVKGFIFQPCHQRTWP